MRHADQRDGNEAGPACFVARQPVFDSGRQVFGYELLFRSGPAAEAFDHPDGDAASRGMVHKSLSVFGIDPLTGGGDRRAFINLTRDVLLQEVADLLPPSRVVVELLETIRPDAAVVAACRRLKEAGYMLALDDFVYDARYDPLLPLADIIKVDFRGSDPARRRQYARLYAPRGTRLLAEKVETWEEYREAIDCGYTLFQGYFFCRPETLSCRAVHPSRVSYLRLLEELSKLDEVDLGRVELLIKGEPALALNLLSYMNSALFGCPNRVTSIRHAALLLGVENLRRWVQLVAVLGLYEGRPPELFVTCTVRARFCELLGGRVAAVCRPFDLFLLGVLSAADAMVGRPLAEALALFSVPAEVREALLTGGGTLGRVFGLLRAYERGAWPEVTALADALGVTEADVGDAYSQALAWAAAARGTPAPARP